MAKKIKTHNFHCSSLNSSTTDNQRFAKMLATQINLTRLRYRVFGDLKC